MKILYAAQMAEVDRLTTEIYHIPSLLLMENAGRSTAEAILRNSPGLRGSRALVFCGKGNNGGDGFVVARYLSLHGWNPEILLFCDPAGLKGDPLSNWEIVKAMGISATILAEPSDAAAYLQKLEAADVIVDALFGTGLSKPIGPEFLAPVEWINKNSSRAQVVAVDIPSGLFANSGEVPGASVRAHYTVTFTALKPALVLGPAADLAGKINVAAIGSPSALVEKAEHRMELVDAALVRSVLPPRARDSHKGTFGHVFVVAGSRGKSGAALMTGLSALRTGAGLVTLWLPMNLQRDIVGKVPEVMTEFLPQTPEGSSDRAGVDDVLRRLPEADALVVGPGLTQQQSTKSLARDLVKRSRVPVVLDADGINAFAPHPEALRNDEGQPIVITPHPGEMARLIDSTIAEVQKDRIETARSFAKAHGCFVVLKGYQTVIASPAGRILINPTGNPGMATGGTGDILAGMVGRFAAAWSRGSRGGDEDVLADYLAAAVYLHGLAGDLAAARKGEDSLIATDILDFLPEAFKQSKEIPSVSPSGMVEIPEHGTGKAAKPSKSRGSHHRKSTKLRVR